MSESPFQAVEAGSNYSTEFVESADYWPLERSRSALGSSAQMPIDEETLMAVPEMLPFGLALFDSEQNFVYGNDPHCKLLGRGIDEAGSMGDWLSSGCPDAAYRDKVLEAWYDDIWTRQLTRTFSLKHAEGGLREVEFRPALLDDGGLLVTLMDTTEQRRAEDSLRLTDAKFRTVFQHAGIGIALIDKTGRFFDVNPAFQTMVKFPVWELRKMSLDECIGPVDLQRLRLEQAEALRSDISTKKRPELEMAFRRKDEQPLRTKVAVAPIRYGDNEAMFTAFFVRDISDEIETRDSLRESQQQNRALLEAIPDLILLLNRDGVMLDAISASAAWEGPEVTNDWIGKSVSSTLPDFGLDATNLVRAALAKDAVQVSNFRIGDNRREYLARVAPVGATKAVVVIEDVTVSKEAREIMALQAAAFTHLRDAIIIADLRGRIRYWNPAAEQIFGFSAEQVIGQGVAKLYSPHEEADFNHQLSTALTLEGQWKKQGVPFYRGDGSAGRCDVLLIPVKSQDSPQSLLGIHRVLE